MLRGRLRDDPGYLETWGTIKARLEVWQEGEDLIVSGDCTDIVELYSWLLPSIQNAYPERTLYLGSIRIPATDAERYLLMLEIRAYFDVHSERMAVVVPSRLVHSATG